MRLYGVHVVFFASFVNIHPMAAVLSASVRASSGFFTVAVDFYIGTCCTVQYYTTPP
ncbi:hypothetical protein IWX50DRAFT_649620 [Phyllosticta citricarpa]